jgi:hypothetical protein
MGVFDVSVGAVLRSDLSPEAKVRSLELLGAICSTFVEGGQAGALTTIELVRGIEAPHALARLEVAAVVSEMLRAPRSSDRDEGLREQIAVASLRDIFASRVVPSATAVSDLRVFLKNAPSFIERMVRIERAHLERVSDGVGSLRDARFACRTDEIIVANLRLLIANSILNTIRNTNVRDARIGRFIASFREYFAAQPF